MLNKNFIIFGIVMILLNSFVTATTWNRVFYDDFSSGSYADTWTVNAGTWSVATNQLCTSTTAAEAIISTSNFSFNSSKKYNISFLYDPPSADAYLIMDFFKNTSSKMFYLYLHTATPQGLWKENGTTTKLLSLPVQNYLPHTHNLEYNGSIWKYYIDGSLNSTDSSILGTMQNYVGNNLSFRLFDVSGVGCFDDIAIYDDSSSSSSYFELTAKNIYDSSAITNFTATITNATTTQTITTTNNTIFWNYNEIVNISVSAFNFVSANFTNINTSSNYIAYLYENNSINISIFDSKTNQIITSTNISLILDGNNTDEYIETIVTNGQYYASYLKSDYYSIKAYSDPIYPPQYYFFNLQNSEHQNINIYLINTSFVSTTTIQIVNQFGIIEENALISLRENINGSFVTVSERLTDSTGTALFYLKTDTTYQAYVTKDGFTPKTATISPYSATYSVTLRIDSNTVYNYSNPLTEIYFSYLPQSLFLYNKTNLQAINITTIAQNGDINWFGLYSGITKTNVSTSLSGGTANINLNISNVSNIIVTLFIDSDLGYFEQNLTYYIGLQESNQSIEQTAKENPINNDFIGYFATAVGCLVMLFIMFELGITPEFFSIGITLILVAFYIFGMISIILPILSGLIAIGGLFMRDS